MRCSNYAQDHLFRREPSDPDIAWCGRPLLGESIELKKSKRTSKNVRCSDCKRYEKECLETWAFWNELKERAERRGKSHRNY